MRIKISSTDSSTGMAIRKMTARCAETVKAITVASTSMIGARVIVRRS